MKRCILLAKKGIGKVSPNPIVGCVIVHKGEIIGEGYHKIFGKEHAEVNAINNVKDKSLLKSATLYVNLEPCSHFGKTPPCSDLIIKFKIPKVVIGCIDYYSKVNGKGIAKLKNHGIYVKTGVLEEESKILNKRFFTFHNMKRPYIILKWAESKDGFIAPENQSEPFWMTSQDSKKIVHKWRSEEDSILIGRITAEKDNPKLTVRKINGRNPIRIVIDKDLKLSDNLNIFNNQSITLIYNTIKQENNNTNLFIKIPKERFIEEIVKNLFKRNILSIIIEGGSKTIQSFIKNNCWDEARIFKTKINLVKGVKSPKVIGKEILKNDIGSDNLQIIYNT